MNVFFASTYLHSNSPEAKLAPHQVSLLTFRQLYESDLIFKLNFFSMYTAAIMYFYTFSCFFLFCGYVL